MTDLARSTNTLRARKCMLARARSRPIISAHDAPLVLALITRLARHRVRVAHVRPCVERREQEVRVELRQALRVDRRERAVEHLVGVQMQGGAHRELNQRIVVQRLLRVRLQIRIRL